MIGKWDPVTGTCGRALDTAGEVCVSCFHVHQPPQVRIPPPPDRSYEGYQGEIDIAEGLDQIPGYRYLTSWPADPDADPGEIECTCGLTFAGEAEFDRHAEEAPEDDGHWNVRNI